MAHVRGDGFGAGTIDVALPFEIGLDLGANLLTRLAELMAVVEELDGLFEANGDEDAEDDDAEVDEEVAECDGCVLRRVDVDHGWTMA
jgi:hypothetical protein